MKPFTAMSLGMKVGLAIVLVEAATLLALGLAYTHQYSQQVDQALLDDMGKPAQLLSLGALKPEGFSSSNMIASLVGPGADQAMLVGFNGNIFHSLDPQWTGQHFSEVPGFTPQWMEDVLLRPVIRETREGTNTYMIFLAQVASGPDRAPFLFSYIKLRTTESEMKKAAIARQFLLGSVAGIVATSVAIILCFRLMITRRLKRVVEAVDRVGRGELDVRIKASPYRDEIGQLKAGFNDMASRLEQTIVSLNKSLEDVKQAESARDTNETNFRKVFESAPVPLAVWRRTDCTIMMINRSAGAVLDAIPEKVAGMPVEKVYPFVDKAAFDVLMKQAGQQGRVDGVEMEIQTRMDRQRWISLSLIPIDHLGSPAFLVASVDLTDHKLAELERISMERKLQETQKLESLGVLAGGIAHDFNNLLTGILGNASLAEMELDRRSPMREYLREIQNSSHRAADLCKQMLAYAGKARLSMQQIDMGSLVTETTNLLKLSISKRARLEFDLAPGLPPVLADPTQLQQIVMNLVMNASDAIGEKDGHIIAKTGMEILEAEELNRMPLGEGLPAGEYVYMEIQDTGCGMSRDTMARIFDPFFTTKFTGRGLGLAAVLGIVRSHNGAMSVHSEEGQGSQFRVFLPPVKNPVLREELQNDDKPRWRGSGRVLLVDDEDTVRTVARRMLVSMGFEVTEAIHGRDGLEKYKASPHAFCAVVLDLTMPQMDGRQALAEIRKINPQARIVLASGFDERETIEKMPEGKGIGFVPKPFSLDQFRERLQGLLASH